MLSARTRSTVLVSVALLGIVCAWWWPGIVGRGDSIDIAISSPPSLASSQDVIERRLREEGFTTKWLVRQTDSCVIPTITGQYSTAVVLLPDSNACTDEEFVEMWRDFREDAESLRLIAVRSWRDAAGSSEPLARIDDLEVDLLDPRPLIGLAGQVQPCLWWDDCPPSGSIDTRIEGSLTDAGQQRLARLIVAEVLD